MNYPNGRHLSRSPYRMFGPGAGLEAAFKNRNDSMNRYIGETWLKTAGTPDGYGIIGLVPAIRSGAMTAFVNILTASGAGDLLSGGPMIGDGVVAELTGSGDVSLIVSLTGDGTMTFTGDGVELKLTMGLSGDGTMTFTGVAGLAMIVPFAGDGAVATMTGTSNLKGRLSMIGEWTPYSTLSPESLATAVWAALASQNNLPSTMGEKLNGAGSAGNPWTEILESGMSAADVLRLILAVQTGKTTITDLGGGLATVVYKSTDGLTDRLVASMTNSERTSVTLQP